VIYIFQKSIGAHSVDPCSEHEAPPPRPNVQLLRASAGLVGHTGTVGSCGISVKTTEWAHIRPKTQTTSQPSRTAAYQPQIGSPCKLPRFTLRFMLTSGAGFDSSSHPEAWRRTRKTIAKQHGPVAGAHAGGSCKWVESLWSTCAHTGDTVPIHSTRVHVDRRGDPCPATWTQPAPMRA
jgi:hypothetical protein